MFVPRQRLLAGHVFVSGCSGVDLRRARVVSAWYSGVCSCVVRVVGCVFCVCDGRWGVTMSKVSFASQRKQLAAQVKVVDEQLGELGRAANELSSRREQLLSAVASLEALESAPAFAVDALVAAARGVSDSSGAVAEALFSAPSSAASTSPGGRRRGGIPDPFSPATFVSVPGKTVDPSMPLRVQVGQALSGEGPFTAAQVAQMLGDDSASGKNRVRMVLVRMVDAGQAVRVGKAFELT